jgi:hypothetical protein
VRLLENDGQGRGHWLQVALFDRRPNAMNRRGLGAKISLEVGGRRQVRWVHTSGSYQASSTPWVHFGLGNSTGPGRLEITWPDGTRQTEEVTKIDQLVVVELR